MAERELPAPKIPPTPKAARAKIADQTRATEPSQKTPKQNPSRQVQPLEPWVVEVTVEEAQGQAPLNPQGPPPHITNSLPNLPVHVPDPEQPPNSPPQVPMQPQNPPSNPQNPMQPQVPPIQMPQLIWLYFKPEFSAKPQEDAIAYLLKTNDWMETHIFPEEAKVQRFCLTLTGEAR